MFKGYKEFTRRELYKKVWSKPMSQLSQEFGLSDVGLAKILKKHNIPRPQRGYWARLEHGFNPPKTPLPKSKKNQDIIISIPVYDRSVSEAVVKELTVVEKE